MIAQTNEIYRVERLSKQYGDHRGVAALNGLDFSIAAGERVAIMGPSGSGKSTLLNLLCGLDVPTDGRIFFESRDLAAMSDDERTLLRRRKMGMIFQTFNLMPTLSGVENVALPLRLDGTVARDASERARRMLERVGLSSRGGHRPDEMSGGERQRVAIARALVYDPSVLLADEPTGNLDSTSGADVLKLLRDLHREFGMTIVLVTHEERAASECERRIELLDGRIVSDTTNGAAGNEAR